MGVLKLLLQLLVIEVNVVNLDIYIYIYKSGKEEAGVTRSSFPCLLTAIYSERVHCRGMTIHIINHIESCIPLDLVVVLVGRRNQ